MNIIRTENFQLTSEQYTLTRCKVTSAAGLRNQVICAGGSPGVGTGLSVVLQFGGQSNNDGEALVNYASPNVTSLTGDGVANADTFGGELESVIGLIC
jgi:hypothetical protein